MNRLWAKAKTWWRRFGTMSAEELQARIASDTTDADVDRFLPPPLRRYSETKVAGPNDQTWPSRWSELADEPLREGNYRTNAMPEARLPVVRWWHRPAAAVEDAWWQFYYRPWWQKALIVIAGNAIAWVAQLAQAAIFGQSAACP